MREKWVYRTLPESGCYADREIGRIILQTDIGQIKKLQGLSL
jgi:hypothetical protein